MFNTPKPILPCEFVFTKPNTIQTICPYNLNKVQQVKRLSTKNKIQWTLTQSLVNPTKNRFHIVHNNMDIVNKRIK